MSHSLGTAGLIFNEPLLWEMGAFVGRRFFLGGRDRVIFQPRPGRPSVSVG